MSVERSSGSPRWQAAVGLTALMLVHHFGLWAWTAFHRGFPLIEAVNRWDSHLYTQIIFNGYADPALRAFLPLYPGVVWLLRAALGGGIPPAAIGCVLSSLCLLGFAAWVSWRGARQPVSSPLEPRTVWGWFFFLYSPGSFALHSHHTEGLFLLLSLGALACAWDGRVWQAALFAALCVWARNQGVLVAITAALLVARTPGAWSGRVGRFAAVGGVALASFAGLLLFHERVSGDWLAHMHAQKNWHHADSLWSAVRGLWFGNEWHRPGWWLGLRNLFAAVWLAGAVMLIRRNWPLGLYGVLSILIMLPQGDLGNAFRFGSVMFPVLFLVGDWFAERPVWLRWTVALLALWLNHKVAHSFSIGSWAY
ncbi:hypothetical protein [Hyalangium versicolor]|uniref:hypothetical protein n=1 Tax=Hyalangium versicolor TaxID=2861190 RepID=UPI001CCF5EF9|nr:hypothetical protein [Hyalangium versicolor]